MNQRPVDRAIIANNLCFARSGTGIRVSSSEDVAVEGNLAGVASLVGLDQLPEKAVNVGGAASRGGVAPGTGAGRSLVGLGDPNQNNVVGNLGDIFQRVDTTPGPRLFVKEADDQPGTGWAPK